MSDEQAVTAAEREYQARLVALHEARAALASASARLRRQHLDHRLAASERTDPRPRSARRSRT